MGTHVIYYCEQPNGQEITDVDYCCSQLCMLDALAKENIVPTGPDGAGTINLRTGGSVEYGACPGGAETDYAVYCPCGELLWPGLNQD